MAVLIFWNSGFLLIDIGCQMDWMAVGGKKWLA